jgi:hypothetical protein
MRYGHACSIVAVLCVAAMVQNAAGQAVNPDAPRVATLILQPAPLDSGAKYALLPPAAELKDGDAAVFYKQAIEALPVKVAQMSSQEWRKVPPESLPQEQAEALMQQAQRSLQLVAQGTMCKNRTSTGQSDLSADLSTIRQIAFLLRVRLHLEIEQKRYEDAIGTIRTALAMGRHLGEGPTVIEGLVGVAIEEMTLQRIEDLAQAPGAPNLLPALKALPEPLIDMEKAIANESPNPNDEATKRIRQITQRLSSTVAGLQCIEALRHYAATHNHQLPARLSDITDVQLPNDPATEKPFVYRLEGSKAVLEVSAPKGGRPKDGVRYEITVAP